MKQTGMEQLVKQFKEKQLAEQIRRQQFAQEIARDCQTDLGKIERQGIPRMVMVDNAVMAAERRLDFFPEESKQALRNNAMLGRRLLKDIEKLRDKGRAIVGLPQSLEPWALSLRKDIDNIGQYLRKNGRIGRKKMGRNQGHDQGLSILVQWILGYREQFDCWEPLSHVIEYAYRTAGRDAEADNITADKLSREAASCRKRKIDPRLRTALAGPVSRKWRRPRNKG